MSKIKTALLSLMLATVVPQGAALANQNPGNNVLPTDTLGPGNNVPPGTLPPTLGSEPDKIAPALLDEAPEPKAELKSKALNLFDVYKQKDMDSDKTLINLYAPDAVIYSGIERERGGVLYDKLDRAAFATQMLSALSNPHIRDLNKQTIYEKPKINHISRDGSTSDLQITFKARRANSGIKVHWMVRETPTGELLIYDEHSISYKLKTTKKD